MNAHLYGLRASIALACLALALSACSKDSSAGLPATFVAPVDGSEFFVAIAAQTDEVLAYVCDGERVDQWFRARLKDGGSFAATGDAGSSLRAELDDGRFNGEIRINGQTYRFSAAQARGDAGLYRSEGEAAGVRELSGWIVLADGRQKGVTKKGDTKTSAAALTAFRSRPTISPI